MNLSVSMRPDPRDLSRVYAELDRLRRIGRSPRRPLLQSALHVQRSAARRLRARKSKWGPSRGRLARSLTNEVWDHGFRVGTNFPYAAIQQVGGDIVPKSVRALAIPMLPSLRRNEVWPRDLPRNSMSFVPVNKGNVVGMLVRATLTGGTAKGPASGKGARGGKARPKQKLGELMYLLVKRVRIPGRPYLLFDAEEEAFLMRALQAEYQRGRGG